MDPNNPIVKLCVAGMRAEGENRFEEARLLFTQAWENSTDDFEACIAAHFLARHQENPQDTLRWNQEALARAEAVGDDRVSDFYPLALPEPRARSRNIGGHGRGRPILWVGQPGHGSAS